MHNIGMAWSQDEDRDFEQNVGARLQMGVLHARYIIDPRTSADKWSFGVSFPSRGYPWEKSSLPR
jgi:hypothetical protein